MLLLLVVNYALLRPVFKPLERLAQRMENVDLLRPGGRLRPSGSREVAGLMKARGLASAILVTSPYHQRRAANLFAAEFGPAKLTFTNFPARDPEWDPNTWWLHEPARTLTVVELAKLSVEVASSALH